MIFPCAILLNEPNGRQTLWAFNVDASNQDEAEGKASRIMRKTHPGKSFLIKVNSDGNAVEPDLARVLPE